MRGSRSVMKDVLAVSVLGLIGFLPSRRKEVHQ